VISFPRLGRLQDIISDGSLFSTMNKEDSLSPIHADTMQKNSVKHEIANMDGD
jgi:hypothetical protein